MCVQDQNYVNENTIIVESKLMIGKPKRVEDSLHFQLLQFYFGHPVRGYFSLKGSTLSN